MSWGDGAISSMISLPSRLLVRAGGAPSDVSSSLRELFQAQLPLSQPSSRIVPVVYMMLDDFIGLFRRKKKDSDSVVKEEVVIDQPADKS